MAGDSSGSVLSGRPRAGYPFGMSIRRIVLGLTLPFCVACPLEDDDDHTGDEGATVDSYSVLGTVTRTDAATPTGDGIGTLYVGALHSCDLAAPIAGAAAVPGADFSAAEAAVDFEIPDLAPGEYALVLFFDEDLDADPTMPLPDPGDLVYADVAGDGVLSCVAIVVDDEDVEALALELTAVVPG